MKVMQLAASGLEGQGGYNFAVLEVDAADEFDTLTRWQDGSVGYVTGSEDIYVKSGTWVKVDRTALPGGRAIDLDGVNPFMLLAVNMLTAKYNALLRADRYQYRILDALPVKEADNFKGMIAFIPGEGESVDDALKVCLTPGEQEVDTVTVTDAATDDGDVTITLNETPVTVTVAEDDTPEAIADKIRQTAFEGWTTSGTGAVCVFTKDAIGICDAPSASAGLTGCVFGNFTRTNQGVDAVWADMINAAGT
ncbi:MAG: hypothetical protein GX748_16565 [Lentisphaerae bacterium]|nr:hypothetical protein [Lentisphaerota bacterium]